MHSLTFRREVIQKMGAIIDENCFYVDMEYCIFPLLYINSFACLDYPVYQYLLGSQTQSMNMENMIKVRAMRAAGIACFLVLAIHFIKNMRMI